MTDKKNPRIESDSLGEMQVPQDALWGSQTQRAVHNFPISGLKPWRAFIWGMASVKRAAAEVNRDLKLLDNDKAIAIMQAADEVIAGKWDDHFVVDPFQAGAGTSQNMNTNEVISNRATQIMGGDPSPVEHFESPVLTRSGTERLIIWHAAPIRVAEGRTVGMILSGRDMSAVSRGDASLTQPVNDLAQTKYALDESAIVATTDVTGTITYVNDTFCTISKYARDELLGQDHRIINSGSHPKEFFRGLWTTIANGRIWKGEIRNRAKDGSIYWVDTTIVPFVDAQGKPYQYMAIRFDITERKRVEALVRDRQALARLGEMAAVVAHEVKNPLAGISGALQVIASRLPADSSDRAIIGDIEQRIGSLNNMVQDLLLFARPTPPTFASTAIAVLLADTATALSQDPELADVEVAISGDQPTLAMDRDQLRIVFQNLLLNAAQAMDGRGTIHVEVRARDGTCEVREKS